MTRHGKNATASGVYSYSERAKDARESGYGTLHQRLGADSTKPFDCCCLTLQPCIDPVVSSNGYLYDRRSVIECVLQQKRENKRKLNEWHRQCDREQRKEQNLLRQQHKAKMDDFTLMEGTPAHPGVANRSLGDDPEAPASKKRKPGFASVPDGTDKVPSFWIPQLNPTAEPDRITKPSQKVVCPVSGRTLRIKELMPVIFTPINDGDTETKSVAKKIRYMCPVTHDALTNTSRCAYLKTSHHVVSMSCVENLIRKDMLDPINGKQLTEDDIIELQRGGTGYSATNKVTSKLARPVLELQ